MIASLTGEVQLFEDDWCIIDVAGIGYQVYLVGLYPEIGERIQVFIYQIIREDRNDLYGFSQIDLRRLFEKLINISGIGAKVAKKILESGNEARIRQVITEGDIDFLTGIPGIGKKTAQKIILELKGILVVEKEDGLAELDTDILDALLSLGYQKKDIIDVIPSLIGESVEEKIRHALKIIGGAK